jgi:hypothetical protein
MALVIGGALLLPSIIHVCRRPIFIVIEFIKLKVNWRAQILMLVVLLMKFIWNKIITGESKSKNSSA